MSETKSVKAKVTVETTNNFTTPAYTLVNVDNSWQVMKVLIDPVTKVASPSVESVVIEKERAFGIDAFKITVGKYLMEINNK